MHLNWGHKLLLAFVLFGSMISYMVYRSTKTNYDLVSPEYYKDEIAYQQVIDGTALANRLQLKVIAVQAGSAITIRFPAEISTGGITGSALFYCSYDARRDKKIVLQPGANGIQEVDSRKFIPGHYVLKLSWHRDGKHYYSELPILIQ